VLELTKEITQLEKSKYENLSKQGTGLSEKERKRLEEQFRPKQKDLERQLKEAKEKNKQQMAVKRQLDQQNNKIKGLESEIQKIKIQKTSA
jgi:predicted  nucleic acid-binding Zn-ribbon protein